jgi:very-short-patch-repair endonuclease
MSDYPQALWMPNNRVSLFTSCKKNDIIYISASSRGVINLYKKWDLATWRTTKNKVLNLRSLDHMPSSRHKCAFLGCDTLIQPRSTYCRKHWPRTPEHIKKQADAERGKIVSEETKAKLRAASISQVRLPHSEETKKKMSISGKGKRPDRIGKTHSEETKNKMSLSHVKRLENMTDEEYEAFIVHKNKYSYFKMSSTVLEKAAQDDLRSQGIIFETQKKIGSYMVDIYVPSRNLVIEVNGCVVHGCELCGYNRDWQLERRKRDLERSETIKSKGYSILIIWEHELAEKGLYESKPPSSNRNRVQRIDNIVPISTDTIQRSFEW